MAEVKKRKTKLSLTAYVSGGLVALFLIIAILAPWLAGKDGIFLEFDPEAVNIMKAKEAPDSVNWFGTDYVGRDVLTQLIHGIRGSLFFSLAVVFVCVVNGILIGGIMGFYGGKVDLILSRFMEVIGNFPIFLLQLTLLAFFDRSYGILLFVMCLAGWIPHARFVRAEFFRLRNQEFVLAARTLGACKTRIFLRHLLPNSLTPVITYIPFDLTSTIISLGALTFLGFGEPLNKPSFGALLKQGNDNFIDAWWLIVFPVGAMFLLTLSLALFGSAIRDILDPRQS